MFPKYSEQSTAYVHTSCCEAVRSSLTVSQPLTDTAASGTDTAASDLHIRHTHTYVHVKTMR